jgi:hypothetical protein
MNRKKITAASTARATDFCLHLDDCHHYSQIAQLQPADQQIAAPGAASTTQKTAARTRQVTTDYNLSLIATTKIARTSP